MYAGRGAADVVEQLKAGGQTDTAPCDTLAKAQDQRQLKLRRPLCTTVMQVFLKYRLTDTPVKPSAVMLVYLICKGTDRLPVQHNHLLPPGTPD